MKYLILILIFVTVGMGQVSIPYSFQPLSKYDTLLYSNDTSWEDLTRHQLLKLLTDYEQECWADSSYKRVHKADNKQYCIIDWECLIPNHWHNIWIHREPTFNGFIEYLRKRK